jgi:hypothetical protein
MVRTPLNVITLRLLSEMGVLPARDDTIARSATGAVGAAFRLQVAGPRRRPRNGTPISCRLPSIVDFRVTKRRGTKASKIWGRAERILQPQRNTEVAEGDGRLTNA